MNYIYKITSPSNKVYIGQHSWQGEGLDPNYFCSSGNPHFWNAVEKYGIENFTKEILEIVDDASMLSERETYWIQQYFGADCYNLNPTGGGGWTCCHSSEVRTKANNTCKENQTGLYGISPKERSDISKKAGKKAAVTQKELGIGVFGMSHEEHVEIGKKAAAKNKELGINFFDSEFQSEQGKKGGKKGGVTSKELCVGIFCMTAEEHSEAGKKGAKACEERGSGIYSMTTEEHSEAGKKGAFVNKQNGTGFYGMTHEEHVDAGKASIVVQQELGINFFDSEFQREQGTKGAEVLRQTGKGLFDPNVRAKAHINYNWYDASGNLVYIGRPCSASKIQHRLGVVWIKGEQVSG